MKKLMYLLVFATVFSGFRLAAQTTDPDGDGRPALLPEVTVVATVPEADEPIPGSLAPERPAIFTLSRTGPTEVALEVFFQLRGSAANGEDYRDIPEQITIPAGESSAMVFISALADELVEGDEVVVLRVLVPPCLPIEPPPPGCYLAGNPDMARAVIHDRDRPPPQPVVNIVAEDPMASEQQADPAIPPDVAIFRIARRGATDIPLEVNYSIRGSAINGVDYVNQDREALSGHVVIPEGESSVSILVFPIDDDRPEPVESVVVELEPLACIAIWPPPPWCYVIGEHAVAEAVIHDNDEPPMNQPPGVAITQPPSGTVFAPPADIDVVVEGNDPDGWIQTLELFANNQKIDEMSIYFIVAPPPGQDQVFTFTWTDAPPGSHALRARATDEQGTSRWSEPVWVVVRETPAIPVVNIWATDPFAREEMPPRHPRNSARFRVRRSGPTDRPLSVDYEIGGTATNGEDYERIAGQVTIPAGRQSAAIHIVPVDDEEPEGVETVILGLFVAVDVDPPPYLVGRHGKAGAVIIDHDQPMPPCRRLRDGLVHIARNAPDGQVVEVLATDALGGEWESLGTITVEDGAVHFVDPDAPDRTFRCYRFVPVALNAIAVDD